MTKFGLTLAAGALALTASTMAFAQPATTAPQGQDTMGAPAPAAPDQQMNTQPMGDQATNAASAGQNTSALGAPDAPQPAEAIRQGDNTLVTNGPVPDTAANRAKYGGPMSMTGKRTKPAGN
jgi:hypothetical protein